MEAWEIIAWHHDGAAFCPDCKPEVDRDGRNRFDEPSPVFATDLDDEQGTTCDGCRACLVGGDWIPFEEATGTGTRWSRCDICNGQIPYNRWSYDYSKARKAALLRHLRCKNCGGNEHF